jgi:hypothetical protein
LAAAPRIPKEISGISRLNHVVGMRPNRSVSAGIPTRQEQHAEAAEGLTLRQTPKTPPLLTEKSQQFKTCRIFRACTWISQTGKSAEILH